MGQLIPWLQVTIPGFVYTSTIIFFLLTVYKKPDLDFNKFKEYFLYFSILIVFFSYVIGFAVHLTIEQILFCIWPGLYSQTENLIRLKVENPAIFQSINDGYSNLVMFRHLILSTLLLSIFLPRWLHKIRQCKFGWVLFILILLIFIFSIAYVLKRQDINHFNNMYINNLQKHI